MPRICQASPHQGQMSVISVRPGIRARQSCSPGARARERKQKRRNVQDRCLNSICLDGGPNLPWFQMFGFNGPFPGKGRMFYDQNSLIRS